MDTTFPHRYECEQLTEGPGIASSPHYYYPGASTLGGRDGILVRIHPDGGQPWIATFAFGEMVNGPSGIFTTPDPQRLCIVSRGAGYFVSANDPRSWECVSVNPVLDIRPIYSHEILVFADFTQLVAYGKSGIEWETDRIAWDDLKINEVTDKYVKGVFWDYGSERFGNFTFDLATGAKCES